MKKLLLFTLLIPLISSGQLFSSLGAGYSTKNNPIATLAFGYDYRLLNFQAEIRPSVTRKVETDNLLGFRLSANLINPDDAGLSILPGVGYYHDLKSSDKTNLNKNVWVATLKSGITVTEDGSLYVEGMYFKNTFQFTIGIQVTFHKQDHPY